MRGLEQRPALYDAGMALMEWRGLGKWRRAVVARTRGRILEIGTGTGRNLPLYPPDSRVVATDPDLLVLLTARTRSPGTPLVVARAEALPFAPGRFDGVVSTLVFCSVDEPAAGLAEIRRVLRSDGTLHMMEHVRSGKPVLGWLQDRIQPFWTWLAGGCRPNRNTEAVVVEAGFAIEEDSYRSRGVMRRFRARVLSLGSGTARVPAAQTGAPTVSEADRGIHTGRASPGTPDPETPDPPPGDSDARDPEAPDLDAPVEVASFRHLHEAELARGYLEDAGIRAAALGDPAGEIQYGKKFSPSARLLVRAGDLDAARRILRRAGVLDG